MIQTQRWRLDCMIHRGASHLPFICRCRKHVCRRYMVFVCFSSSRHTSLLHAIISPLFSLHRSPRAMRGIQNLCSARSSALGPMQTSKGFSSSCWGAWTYTPPSYNNLLWPKPLRTARSSSRFEVAGHPRRAGERERESNASLSLSPFLFRPPGRRPGSVVYYLAAAARRPRGDGH
jgi:hypothetical protein